MEITKETRFFHTQIGFEERDGKKDENIIVGHASVFNKDSLDLGGFIERMAPGAFDDVLNDDAIALFNHDPNLVIGRNKVNVQITQDETGLKYRVEMPDTTLAKDLRELISRGIINQSSFGFTVKEQRWEHFKGKPSVRTVVKVQRLYDVSPVTMAAYPDATVAARSYEKEIENNKPSLSLFERERQLKIKLNKTK